MGSGGHFVAKRRFWENRLNNKNHIKIDFLNVLWKNLHRNWSNTLILDILIMFDPFLCYFYEFTRKKIDLVFPKWIKWHFFHLIFSFKVSHSSFNIPYMVTFMPKKRVQHTKWPSRAPFFSNQSCTFNIWKFSKMTRPTFVWDFDSLAPSSRFWA